MRMRPAAANDNYDSGGTVEVGSRSWRRTLRRCFRGKIPLLMTMVWPWFYLDKTMRITLNSKKVILVGAWGIWSQLVWGCEDWKEKQAVTRYIYIYKLKWEGLRWEHLKRTAGGGMQPKEGEKSGKDRKLDQPQSSLSIQRIVQRRRAWVKLNQHRPR